MLLSTLLHREKVFFQFAASHPDFHFTLLKTTFLLVYGQVTLFSALSSLPNHSRRSILPKEYFGLLATKLSCFKPYVAKKRFSLSVFKIRCV